MFKKIKVYIRDFTCIDFTHFRPTFISAIFISTGILLGYDPKADKLIVIFLCSFCVLLLFFSFLKNKNLTKPLVYLTFAIIGIVSIFVQTNTIDIPKKETWIKGRIVEAKHYDYSSYYVLEDCKIDNIGKIKHGIRLNSYDNSLVFGDVIYVKAQISPIKSATNIDGFDKRKYYFSKNIAYTAKSRKNDVIMIENSKKIDSVFLNIKQYMIDNIQKSYDEDTFGVALGFVLGDKGEMDSEIYDNYKIGGIASILAVSGLHLGILFVFFLAVLTRLGVHRKVSYVIVCIFAIFYAGIVGFSVSILRALVICILYSISVILGKKSDFLGILSFAYILLLIINPVSIFSVGFQLSFGAVFAITSLAPVFTNLLKPLPTYINNLVSASFPASIGVAPFIINTFSYFSVIGIVANIVVIPIASIAIIMVFLSAFIVYPINIPFSYIGESLIMAINKIMDFFLKSPITILKCKKVPNTAIFLWLISIFIISKFCLLDKKSKKSIFIFLLILMIILTALPQIQPHGLQVYFFDINQGDAAFIKTPSGKCYMIDTGKPYYTSEITSFLSKNGYKLDGVFITHEDSDHSGGAYELVSQGYVSDVYIAAPDNHSYDIHGANYIKLIKGDRIYLDKDTYIDVLYPDFTNSIEDTNNMSLVLELHYKGYKVLFTGDIDKSVEKEIKYYISDVDVLKVAHHGSKNSSCEEILKKANAEYAIISVGANSFGHPSEQTLYNLNEYCDIIYTTMNNGGILFEFNDRINSSTVFDGALIW